MGTAAENWRDYNTDGMPASLPFKPIKADLRTWGLGLENGIKGVHNADIPSATTLDLTAAAGELVDVTGTAAVTAITLPEGNECVARFTGALTLTNGASLVLPGAANIVTVAGDFAIFRGYAAGVVRCVIYSRADGKALIAPTAGTLVSPGQVLNFTIAESHSANAVTYALKTLAGTDPSSSDPVKAYFRNATPGTGNYVERTINAALSITIPATASMGFISGSAGNIWFTLHDDGGTPRLGVTNCLSGTSIFPLGQFPIANSTTISTGADNAHVTYTDAGVTAKPYLILGYASYQGANVIATAGTWANSPLRIHLQGPNDRLPGDIIQPQGNATGAVATGTTAIPRDDTIPQNTEGDQYLSQAITITSEANLLEMTALLQLSNASNANHLAGLFQDSVANALAVGGMSTNTTVMNGLRLEWSQPAGANGVAAGVSTTIKARAGSTGGTTTFNGESSARRMGGVANSFIKIIERLA